jgi:hypothetical protein
MGHEELLKEATELERCLSEKEKLSWAFRYSYMANHGLTLVIEKLEGLTKLVWGILLALVLTLGSAVIGMVFKALGG